MNPPMKSKASLVHICGIAGVFCLTMLALAYTREHYVQNWTSSMPPGLYRKHPVSPALHAGDIVLLCPEKTPILEEALNRRYLMDGDRQCWVTPLIKRVAACEGDTVKTTAFGITVNDTLIPNSRARSSDSKGRLLPVWSFEGTLADGDLLVLTDRPNSFDSRYFGLLRTSDVVSRLTPAITF